MSTVVQEPRSDTATIDRRLRIATESNTIESPYSNVSELFGREISDPSGRSRPGYEEILFEIRPENRENLCGLAEGMKLYRTVVGHGSIEITTWLPVEETVESASSVPEEVFSHLADATISPIAPMSGYDLSRFKEATHSISKSVIDMAARLGVSQQLPRVLQFTRELFGCSPTVRVEHDPEIPDYTCLVVDVTTMESVEEAVRKNDEWHQHLVSNVRESLEVFCLSIDIQS